MNINDADRHHRIIIPFFRRNHEPTRNGLHRDGRPASQKSNRLHLLDFLPDVARNHLIAAIGEFVGTLFFLLLAFGATSVANLASLPVPNVVGTPSNPSQLLYIALAFGFALAVNAWIFFRVSGGLFNPAVVLALCLIGALPWTRGAVLFVAEFAGAIAGAAITSALLPGDLATVRVGLGGGTSITRGLFIEAFLTFQLVFTILFLAVEKSKATFIAPIGIGLSLFIDELMGVYYTGGAANPIRALAPSLVSYQFHGYHWIYWVGSALGATIAALTYQLLKKLNYETSNPHADRAQEELPFDPNEDHGAGRVSFAPNEMEMEEGRSVEKAPFRDDAPPSIDPQLGVPSHKPTHGVAPEQTSVITGTSGDDRTQAESRAARQPSPPRGSTPVTTSRAPGAGVAAVGGTPTKSAMRPGSSNNTPLKENSVKANTYNNRTTDHAIV